MQYIKIYERYISEGTIFMDVELFQATVEISACKSHCLIVYQLLFFYPLYSIGINYFASAFVR